MSEPDIKAEGFLLTVPAWSESGENLELSKGICTNSSCTHVREAILIVACPVEASEYAKEVCTDSLFTRSNVDEKERVGRKTALIPDFGSVDAAVAALVACGIEDITLLASLSCEMDFSSEVPATLADETSAFEEECAPRKSKRCELSESYDCYIRQRHLLPSCYIARYDDKYTATSGTSSFLSTLRSIIITPHTMMKGMSRGMTARCC